MHVAFYKPHLIIFLCRYSPIPYQPQKSAQTQLPKSQIDKNPSNEFAQKNTTKISNPPKLVPTETENRWSQFIAHLSSRAYSIPSDLSAAVVCRANLLRLGNNQYLFYLLVTHAKCRRKISFLQRTDSKLLCCF